MVGYAWRGRKESCGRTPHEETGARTPRRSFRRLRRLVANGRFTWLCSLRWHLVAICRECLAESGERTATRRTHMAATAGQLGLLGVRRQGVSRAWCGESCQSNDKSCRRGHCQCICEGRYWSRLLPAIRHVCSPPFNAYASFGARYYFFEVSSSSSGIFGNLCATPLWQSIQVKPALNPASIAFAAASVCLCGSIASAE
jgi:hypothetical protein